MGKLSKREKVLLYVLLLVAVIAAGWFLIKPAMDETTNLQVAIEESELQKASAEATIALRPGYAESKSETEAQIEELKKAFLPVMTNDDLDRYITGLLQKNLLTAESLLISPSADESMSLAVTKLTVRVTATGELEQFMELVEQVSGLNGIRIAGLTVQQQEVQIKEVPLTPEEIAELEAEKTAANAKPAGQETEPEGIPTKEVSVMQYSIAVDFEVMEFDAAMFAAMAG